MGTSENKESIEIMLSNYDDGARYYPEDVIRKIVDSKEISKGEKVLYLNRFKKSMLQKTAESIPGADNLTPEFVDKYEKDLGKYETADSAYKAAREAENQYSRIAYGYKDLSDSFQTIRSEIGDDKANAVAANIDNVIIQCIEQGDIKAFDDFAANSPLQKANTALFRSQLRTMTKCDVNLAKKYTDNRGEFMQAWRQKFTEMQQADANLYQTTIGIKRDYLKVPDIARKASVISSVVNYKMFLPQDDAAYHNFLHKTSSEHGPIWNDARDETSKQFVNEVYGFIEKRVAEGKIQEPSVLYKGKIPEALANFAASAKKCIAEKRPLTEMQLPKGQEEELILRFGHLPNKYDLDVMKNALEVSNIYNQTIKKQAEENVGGKSDNSVQDKLAAKTTKSYEDRKTTLDARIVANIQNKYSK